MKVLFNRHEISEAVAPLMCAVSGKSTLSAVEGILIDARENQTCIMTTFDLEKGMRIQVAAEVKEPGCYVINAQKFVQTLRVMEGDFVTLTVNESNQACISSGTSSHRMNAISGNDYPVVPRLVTEDGFIISQAILKEMIGKVMYAMAINDQRPMLNGCYFKVEEGRITAVACDSFKLAKCAATAEIENKKEDGTALKFDFIIPTKTVNELYKLLKDDEDATARIYLTRKNIVFNIGEIVFFSRLIEGQYIDYNRIILNNHRIFVTVNKDKFISALERAALVTEEKVAGSVRSHVKLDFEGDLLKISALSAQGSTYDEIQIAHEGDDLGIAFNNRFLIDSVRSVDTEELKISMSSALTSINVEPVKEDDGKEDLFMLLPVRMKE